MSELKAFEVTRKALFGRTCTEKVYLKSEAEKVIADMNERYFELQDTAIKIDEELTETKKAAPPPEVQAVLG